MGQQDFSLWTRPNTLDRRAVIGLILILLNKNHIWECLEDPKPKDLQRKSLHLIYIITNTNNCFSSCYHFSCPFRLSVSCLFSCITFALFLFCQSTFISLICFFYFSSNHVTHLSNMFLFSIFSLVFLNLSINISWLSPSYQHWIEA